MRPRLLDLFCGAGGAAMGYSRAGFDVVGVDIRPQPRYPFAFIQADALEYMDWFCGDEPSAHRDCCAGHRRFDAIHASPPCQAYTTMSNRWRKGEGTAADRHVDLIGATRDLLKQTGLPYVIENVMGARAMMGGNLVRVCGSSVGLRQRRHRLFECGGWMPLVPPCACRGKGFKYVIGERPDGRWLQKNAAGVKSCFVVSSLEEGREAMGIDWMEWRELCEAIPPAYTELIGAQLMQHVNAAHRARPVPQARTAG